MTLNFFISVKRGRSRVQNDQNAAARLATPVSWCSRSRHYRDDCPRPLFSVWGNTKGSDLT